MLLLLASLFSTTQALSTNSTVEVSSHKKVKKNKPVYIKPNILSIKVTIDGEDFVISRNQDRKHLLTKFYQKTGRGIIKPMHPFKPHAVETIAEHEMIGYIAQLNSAEHNVEVVDARKSIWLTLTGTLPGAIHVPFNKFKKDKEYALETMQDDFGVYVSASGDLNFSQAKTLAIYCNGNWCKMSPELIWKLLEYGYPAEKIKYYRGGMQAWQLLGLNVVE